MSTQPISLSPPGTFVPGSASIPKHVVQQRVRAPKTNVPPTTIERNSILITIQDLQAEAEKLGYATLVAEGSAIVMSLIQTGKVEAIVGVSCLSVLERAFPYMEAAAIPGVAIPLLQDDCIDTTVDLDWVWEYIHLTSDDRTRRLDLGALRDEVDFWFMPASLDLIMGSAEGETERIGREWLGRAGKRWRPF